MIRADELTMAIQALVAATRAVEKLLSQQANSERPIPNTEIISPKDAARLLGCGVRTLKVYRDEWREGVHYWRQTKGYRYNRILLEDWLKNRFDPVAHQSAIEKWAKKKK